MSNGGISYSKTIEDVTNQYLTENDSVLSFIYEQDMKDMPIDGKAIDTIYLQYQNYCEDNGLNPVGKIAMSRRINTAGYKTKVKKINGKAKKVYEKRVEWSDIVH